MKVSRLVLITFVLLGIVGLTAFWGGSPAVPVDGSIDEIIPESGSEETLASTWYCAAGGIGRPHFDRTVGCHHRGLGWNKRSKCWRRRPYGRIGT